MSEVEARSKGADIFLTAADYIRRYGWHLKGMGRHGQARCSMGALASAYPLKQWEKNLASVMYEALRKELNGLSLTEFNQEASSGEKVASLFERTALSLAK